MKLKSARQAWFMAFYDGKPNTMVETLKLGVFIQKTDKCDTTAIAIHQWLAGKVQHAISTLLPPLQCLGNYFYKPTYSNEDLKIAHEVVKIGVFEKYAGERWSTSKLDRFDALVYVAMENYKSIVNSGAEKFKSYTKICDCIKNNFDKKIDPSHWHRDWLNLYDKIIEVCNDLDKLALEPVSRVVKDYKNNNKKLHEMQLYIKKQ